MNSSSTPEGPGSVSGAPPKRLFTPIIMQHLIGNPGSVPANQLWGAAHGTV